MSLKMKFSALLIGVSQSLSASPANVQKTNPEMSGEDMASCFALIHYAQSYNTGNLEKAKATAASQYFLLEGEKKLGDDKFSDAGLATAEKYVPALEATKRDSLEKHSEIKMSLARDATACMVRYEIQKTAKVANSPTFDIEKERKINPAGAQALSCVSIGAVLNANLGDANPRLSSIRGMMHNATREGIKAYGSQDVFGGKVGALTIVLSSEIRNQKTTDIKVYEASKSKLVQGSVDCLKIYPEIK